MGEPAPPWLLALLRSPCCMSELAPAGEALQCTECRRAYTADTPRPGLAPIPRLKRDDALATLAQDVVVYQEDPDSTRADRRRLIAYYERRERFLAPLLRDISRPYAILAARPDWTPRPPDAAEIALFERFASLLPPDGTVLDLACGAGRWTRRMAERGFRAVGADSSAPSLQRAATTPVTPGPAPSQPRARSDEGSGQSSPSLTRERGDAAQQRSLPLTPPMERGQGSDCLTAYVEADLMEMPFAAATMDGVWCSEAFEYVRPDRRAVFFRQVHRVLRPGGLLYLSAETEPLRRVVRQYLLWRVVFGKPVQFWEYIYRLPRAHGGGWHYHVMTSAHTLHRACREHGLDIIALRRTEGLWLLLARKKG